MGAVDTTYTFTATDTITSAKMNNIIDQTTITTDAIIGTTLEVASGKLKIRSAGITSNELGTDSVTSNAILDGTIVNADINASAAIDLSKLATGALPTAITIASANIVDGTIATADIADANITAAKLDGAQTGTAPIYGVRAYAVINGGSPATFYVNNGFGSVTRIATGKYTLTLSETPPSRPIICATAISASYNVSAAIYGLGGDLKTFSIRTGFEDGEATTTNVDFYVMVIY